MKHIADTLVSNNIVQINFETPFLWTSGIKSPIYCDCRELISLPDARNLIVDTLIAQLTNIEKIDAIAGTATAGIPWAAFVAEKLKKPMLYVRSKPKGYGAEKMVEGRGQQKSRIIVVEDALSTAGSSIKSAEALRHELKAKVSTIFAIFSWDTPSAKKSAENAQLQLQPLTTFPEIVESLLEQDQITEDQKIELERFHDNPADWWQT